MEFIKLSLLQKHTFFFKKILILTKIHTFYKKMQGC